MALIAALVALEKLSPRHDLPRTLTAAVLATLAVAVLVAPHAVPGFTMPGVPMHMSGMGPGR